MSALLSLPVLTAFTINKFHKQCPFDLKKRYSIHFLHTTLSTLYDGDGTWIIGTNVIKLFHVKVVLIFVQNHLSDSFPG